MAKKTLQERTLEAETRGNKWLADGNEASERGNTARAEQCYAKGQYWLDRYNLLAGNAEGPPPKPGTESRMSISTEEEMRAHRRKNFAIRVDPPHDEFVLFEGEKVFRITHNGRQDVAVLSLAPHEARMLYEQLRAEFDFKE
jgi:hypothetical protein